mgnify:CR=1 FL=1
MENFNEVPEIEKKGVVVSDEESRLIRELLELTEEHYNPYRKQYIKEVLRECYNFKELKQWESNDEIKLIEAGVPPISVDRINRNLDTINGIRDNTNSKKRVSKRELGDEKVAYVLDKVCDYVDYAGSFSEMKDNAFNDMLDVGLGIRKVGFDEKALGGEGEIWCDNVNVEDIWWGRSRKKIGRAHV